MQLGYNVNGQLDDSDDVRYRRNCFIGQSNNALYFFNNLDLLVGIKLFQRFSISM